MTRDDLDDADEDIRQQQSWGEGFHDRALKRVLREMREMRRQLKDLNDRVKALEER